MAILREKSETWPGASQPGCLDIASRQEIASKHNDLVRVGKLHLNGSLLTWDVHGCTPKDLDSMCQAFRNRLKDPFAEAGMGDKMASRVIYEICKGLSANYMLMDVITKVREVVGTKEDVLMCIPTASNEGTMPEYFVDILHGCKSLRMGIRWPWTGNVVEMCPCSGQKAPQGTLSCIQTQFSIPPPPDFQPEYEVRLKLKSSFWSTKCIVKPVEPLTSRDAVVKPNEYTNLHDASTCAGSSLEDDYGSSSSTSTFQPGSDSSLLKDHESSATQDASAGIHLLAYASTESNSCPALSSIAEADDIKHTQGVEIPTDSMRENDDTTFFGVRVKPADGGEPWTIQRRYRDFLELYSRIAPESGHLAASSFPRKHMFACTGKKLHTRREGLEMWLSEIVKEAQAGQPGWLGPLSNFLEVQSRGAPASAAAADMRGEVAHSGDGIARRGCLLNSFFVTKRLHG